jgi:hypothetical protein
MEIRTNRKRFSFECRVACVGVVAGADAVVPRAQRLVPRIYKPHERQLYDT